MRIVTYGGACSLDGFIAGPDDALDWLRMNAEVGRIVAEYWKGIDTLIMGRKTWDFASRQWGTTGDMTSNNIQSYVFSRTLTKIDRPGVHLVKEDAAAFVASLKKQPGKNICVFGGGDFARSLFEAGLIDEVGMNIHPVLLGSGAPGFLDAHRRVDLELAECRQLPDACVYVRYLVKHKRRVKPRP